MITKNKYSDLKIIWFRDKLESLKNNKIISPICVRIKPTNKCCHKCFFCVYNYDFSKMHETTNKIDEIKLDKMYEILDDLKHIGVKAVQYTGGGEPLVHKSINKILQKTLDNGLDLALLTNGQFLKGKTAELLTNAKWLRISLDYYSAKSFIDSSRGNKKMFQQIVENIKNFIKINKQCELGINYIITKNNYNNLIDSARFLNDLGVNNIRYSPVWVPDFFDYHKFIEGDVLTSLNFIKNSFSKNMDIYNSYKIVKDVNERKYNKCYFMQIVPVIGADLNVYNCHNKAYSNDGIIGSIKDKNFSDLWFSKETQEYFNCFRPDLTCNHQCANDKKNIYLHEIINSFGDNYV